MVKIVKRRAKKPLSKKNKLSRMSVRDLDAIIKKQENKKSVKKED